MFADFGNLILENVWSHLRPLKSDDFELLQDAAFSHPDLLLYSPSKIDTSEKLKKYIKEALEAKQKGIRFPFIIFDKRTNTYAGSTSFGNPSSKDLRVEIGWTWIGKQYQKTGLNRSNKFLMLTYGFEELGLKRIELKTDMRNLQSRMAMKKIGVTEEGVLRSHTKMSDGFRRDTIYYSILESEWPDIKNSIFKTFI